MDYTQAGRCSKFGPVGGSGQPFQVISVKKKSNLSIITPNFLLSKRFPFWRKNLLLQPRLVFNQSSSCLSLPSSGIFFFFLKIEFFCVALVALEFNLQIKLALNSNLSAGVKVCTITTRLFRFLNRRYIILLSIKGKSCIFFLQVT